MPAKTWRRKKNKVKSWWPDNGGKIVAVLLCIIIISNNSPHFYIKIFWLCCICLHLQRGFLLLSEKFVPAQQFLTADTRVTRETLVDSKDYSYSLYGDSFYEFKTAGSIFSSGSQIIKMTILYKTILITGLKNKLTFLGAYYIPI